MKTAFLIIAGMTLLGAVGAVTLRKPVHCALSAVLSFFGLAAVFLLLGAEFVAFAQILVYVGALSILLVFAILLTRNQEGGGGALFFQPWTLGLGTAALVTGVLVSAAYSAGLDRGLAPERTDLTVRALGEALMTRHVVALEAVGLLLTAALIGAVLIALREKEGRS